jgi:monoamine oxidase
MSGGAAVDALVIGAGFSGLAAADALRKRSKSVALVEARDRVGGRARTESVGDGLWLDYGGQWLGPGQREMYALARRFGHATWPMYVAGRHVTYLSGVHGSYRGTVPLNLSWRALANMGAAVFRFQRMMSRVDLSAPWQARDADDWDRQSLGDWMRRYLTNPDAFSLFEVAAESVLAVHPDDVSLLHALFYMRSARGFFSATSSAGGAQQDRLERGVQPLAESLAAELRDHDVEITLGCAVKRVSEQNGVLRVQTEQGSIEAKTVICATPPALASEIEFEPALSGDKRQLLENLQPGCAIKCFAVYEAPFWRTAGYSGSAVGDRDPIHVCFDVTPPGEPRGILMGFIEGRQAVELSEAGSDARRERALRAFTEFFGEQAARPIAYHDHTWRDDPWARGCYAGMPGLNHHRTVGHLIREPHGRVLWAGTETATHWNGYFEGAVRAGRRAAGEAVGRL